MSGVCVSDWNKWSLHRMREATCMKRRVIQLVLLLIAGAIMNVAVAWGYSAWGSDNFGLPHEMNNMWLVAYPDFIEGNTQVSYDTVGLTLETLVQYAEAPDATNLHRPISVCSGWPTRSLKYWIIARPGTDSHWADRGIETSLQMTNPYFTPFSRRLPLVPMWPGFAINTIFYAAILWVLFAVPLGLRRRRRIRRGLCPACAYPVGISPVCTECGKPLV